MKSRPTQFGARKNTASSQQRALRLRVDSLAFPSRERRQDSHHPHASPSHGLPWVKTSRLGLAEPISEARGGEKREATRLLTVHEVAEFLQVPASWVYERTRKRGADQLPHLKIGKYLRFEEPAVTEFIQRQRRT